MAFAVGETVVYPHHGAALIEEISARTIRGEEKLYLKLKVTQGDLTIEVPAANVELVGVRDVVGREGLERVFEVLRADVKEEPTNWSRRYKANVEKIASGDVIKVSEVVRDLSRRDLDRGLSAGEKRMLARARQILVSELALAEDIEEATAETRLDAILAGPEPPEDEAAADADPADPADPADLADPADPADPEAGPDQDATADPAAAPEAAADADPAGPADPEAGPDQEAEAAADAAAEAAAETAGEPGAEDELA